MTQNENGKDFDLGYGLRKKDLVLGKVIVAGESISRKTKTNKTKNGVPKTKWLEEEMVNLSAMRCRQRNKCRLRN